jgi:hypothetical protein
VNKRNKEKTGKRQFKTFTLNLLKTDCALIVSSFHSTHITGAVIIIKTSRLGLLREIIGI